MCVYGLTISFWIQFSKVEDETYIIDTGNSGFRVTLFICFNNTDELINLNLSSGHMT